MEAVLEHPLPEARGVEVGELAERVRLGLSVELLADAGELGEATRWFFDVAGVEDGAAWPRGRSPPADGSASSDVYFHFLGRQIQRT